MQTSYTTKEAVTAAYTTTATDDQINAAIKAVSSHIDTFVGYRLASDIADGTRNIIFDGSGTRYVMLLNDIHGFTALKLIADDGSEQDVTNVVSYPLGASYTSYFGIRAGVFTRGMANYNVPGVRTGRYTTDWTAPGTAHTLPDDIAAAATSLAISLLRSGGTVSTAIAKSGNVSGETIGSYSVTYSVSAVQTAIAAVPSATTILEAYKRVVIA